MEIEKIKSLLAGLADLLETCRLEEIEVQEGELRLRLRRGARPPERAAAAAPDSPAAAPAPPAEAVAAPPAASAAPAANHLLVKSPIVGTFYSAPSPGSPEFVKVGDQVEVGQVLCIIEAMKLMNEIEAEVAGEVVRKMATNGQPVEYGEPLFEIRPKR